MINVMKNSFERLASRFNIIKKKISESKNKLIEINQAKSQREKGVNTKNKTE